LGSDSHTPAAGSLGMLAIGTGGLEVAMAIVGEPYYVKMPEIWGIKLTGALPDWVSAKDVILEMLRRHGVSGGTGRIIEYYGPGLKNLTAMDRHVICNMGTELGATTSIFPSDELVHEFMNAQGRGNAWKPYKADEGCEYDYTEEINLSELEPLIALPSSPGNVKPVSEVIGRPILQSYIGSSANPGLRDFAICALILKDKKIQDKVSFDVNPSTAQTLENLIDLGLIRILIESGARIHEPGCNGCVGMGQAPPSNAISLRTVPRNFPDRSGTKNDQVYLCSPETATVSAIMGEITDPKDIGMKYPKFQKPKNLIINTSLLIPPPKKCLDVELRKGPNIKPLPKFDPLPGKFDLPVIIKVGNDISTDEIMPAGAKVLPFRSNIPEISKFVFKVIDEDFYNRAMEIQKKGSIIIAGTNYGQGSSREHAAIAPRYLGIRAVIAKSYARIHWQNLINFGIVPLTFFNEIDWKKINQGDILSIKNLRQTIQEGTNVIIENITNQEEYNTSHSMSQRQIKAMLAGSLINTSPELKKICED